LKSSNETEEAVVTPFSIQMETHSPLQNVISRSPISIAPKVDESLKEPVEERAFSSLAKEISQEGLEEDVQKSAQNKRKREYKSEEDQQQQNIIQLEKEFEREAEKEHSLALLRGRTLRYHIKSRQVMIGRNTEHSTVDVNLAEEGSASKISREQGVIKLKANGSFYLKNVGKNPIYINGKVISIGEKKRLLDCCLIEVGGLNFIFEMNRIIMQEIRQQLS